MLGIESSCDDTGVGVVTSSKRVLGQAAFSQLPVHLKYVHHKNREESNSSLSVIFKKPEPEESSRLLLDGSIASIYIT